MAFFRRGALVEYGMSVLGPIPNLVVFQFNPENIARTLNIPSDRTEARQNPRANEPHQVSAPPTETFTITAHFSAADDLGKGGAVAAIPRVFGIGPQLAALERMVYPGNGLISGAVGAVLDAVGSALGAGSSGATRPTPREQVPRILFIWGPSRVLPVRIQTMTITEQKYDPFLNPVQAEVQIGMAVQVFPQNERRLPDDPVGTGALLYTQTVKDAQAAANLVKAVELAVDIIPF